MFYYFFFFWTLALISHVQLSTVAGSTFYWYYHRYVPEHARTHPQQDGARVGGVGWGGWVGPPWCSSRRKAWGERPCRDEARNTRPLTVSGPTVDALRRALTTSFGTLCMSGLVLAIARLMRLILDRMLSVRVIAIGRADEGGPSRKGRRGRAVEGRPSRAGRRGRPASTHMPGRSVFLSLVMQSTNRENAWWARMLTSCGGFIERILMQVSSFVVIYNALTGDSFCTSSRDMTGVLRRNLLDRFVVGMLSLKLPRGALSCARRES